MRDWINRNVEGLGLAVFLLLGWLMFGLYHLMMATEKRHDYIVEHNLVKVEGYVKAKDLQHIEFQEVKEK